MGLDVNLYAEIDPSSERLAAAEEFFTERTHFGDKWDDREAILGVADEEWFPEAKVYYGSDSFDDGLECTEEFLVSIWEHFLGPHGNDYRSRL